MFFILKSCFIVSFSVIRVQKSCTWKRKSDNLGEIEDLNTIQNNRHLILPHDPPLSFSFGPPEGKGLSTLALESKSKP